MTKERAVFNYTCDRCGQDMNHSDDTVILDIGEKKLDLCESCAKDFKRFIRGKSTKRVKKV